MRVIYGLGRVIVGGFFLYNGINHFTHVDELAGYAAAKHRPNPREEVQASGALLVASGASLAFGIQPRIGAAGIAAFLAAASPIFHDFWERSDPAEKQNDMIHFSKNMALLGAALAFMGTENKGDCG